MEVTVAVAAVVVAAVGVLVGHDATVPVHLGALIGCLAGWRTTAASTAAHFRTGALPRPVRHLYKGTGRALRDREISRGSQSVRVYRTTTDAALMLWGSVAGAEASSALEAIVFIYSVGYCTCLSGFCPRDWRLWAGAEREREYWKER